MITWLGIKIMSHLPPSKLITLVFCFVLFCWALLLLFALFVVWFLLGIIWLNWSWFCAWSFEFLFQNGCLRDVSLFVKFNSYCSFSTKLLVKYGSQFLFVDLWKSFFEEMFKWSFECFLEWDFPNHISDVFSGVSILLLIRKFCVVSIYTSASQCLLSGVMNLSNLIANSLRCPNFFLCSVLYWVFWKVYTFLPQAVWNSFLKNRYNEK